MQSRWDAARAKRKGQGLTPSARVAKTGWVHCHVCGSKSRQPTELRQRWLDRHFAAKHPQETLF